MAQDRGHSQTGWTIRWFRNSEMKLPNKYVAAVALLVFALLTYQGTVPVPLFVVVLLFVAAGLV